MASKNTSFHEGPLAGVLLSLLKLAFSVGLGLVAILLVAWSIDWMFVSRVRPDGVDRLHSLLAADLGHGISLAARQGRGGWRDHRAGESSVWLGVRGHRHP